LVAHVEELEQSSAFYLQAQDPGVGPRAVSMMAFGKDLDEAEQHVLDAGFIDVAEREE